MATSSIVIAGATYSDVPSVTLKDTSNTDVSFVLTTDATASASDIRTGKSGYVNGSKVNGSLVVNTVYVGSTDPSSSFGNDGDIYIKVV